MFLIGWAAFWIAVASAGVIIFLPDKKPSKQ